MSTNPYLTFFLICLSSLVCLIIIVAISSSCRADENLYDNKSLFTVSEYSSLNADEQLRNRALLVGRKMVGKEVKSWFADQELTDVSDYFDVENKRLAKSEKSPFKFSNGNITRPSFSLSQTVKAQFDLKSQQLLVVYSLGF